MSLKNIFFLWESSHELLQMALGKDICFLQKEIDNNNSKKNQSNDKDFVCIVISISNK